MPGEPAYRRALISEAFQGNKLHENDSSDESEYNSGDEHLPPPNTNGARISGHDTSIPSNQLAVVDKTLAAHLRLVTLKAGDGDASHEVVTAPLFVDAVRGKKKDKGNFSQWGFLGADVHGLSAVKKDDHGTLQDPRVFCNVAAPLSVFICGSQGSGKSHTLSVFLENYLTQSVANQLPRPLTGIVFYYDSLTSDFSGSPCEASYLSSNPNISVRVLCSRTNISNIKVSVRIWSRHFPSITDRRS